jgi:hypothetical protein
MSLTLLMVVALLSVASSLQTGRGFNERQTLDEVPRCLYTIDLPKKRLPIGQSMNGDDVEGNTPKRTKTD